MPASKTSPHVSSPGLRERGLIRVFGEMIDGMLKSRYVAYRLVVKDVRADYSKSAFGIIWDFVDPLVLGSIFYLLMKIGIVRPGGPAMPFAVFVIYGVLLYETFSESILLSLNIIQRSKNILTHLKVPPEALILSVAFRVLFNSIFRIAIMLAFSLALHSTAAEQGESAFDPLGFLQFLIFFPMMIVAGLSVGVFLAPFNAVYSDVGRFVKVVLVPLRYATPVFYTLPEKADHPILQTLLDIAHTWNPVAYLLVNLRMLATSGALIEIPATLLCCALFGVLFLVGWLVFHLAIPVLAERA